MARNDFSPEMAEVTSDMVVIEPRAQNPIDPPWQSKILEGVDDFRKSVHQFAGQTFSQIVPQAANRADRDASSDDTEEAAETEEQAKKIQHAQLIVKKTLGMEQGPKITLKCIDCNGGKKGVKDVVVEWKHSWEDVLRQLKRDFKRDVIFEYEVAGRVCRVHDDATFDRAMALAERSGNKLYVVIQDAVWKTAPEEEVEQEEPEPEEQASGWCVGVQRNSFLPLCCSRVLPDTYDNLCGSNAIPSSQIQTAALLRNSGSRCVLGGGTRCYLQPWR